MELYETLKKYFNFTEFKPLQKELILKLLAKKDVLAVLPTGYGKSLIYQITGLMLKGITIVITPLISLMKDQVDSLEAKGIKACFINSLVSKAEQEKIYANILSYKFIYVSPERLNNPSFYSQIKNVSLVVMDEAHTMLWGLEFRKAMLDIKAFINRFKERPIIAAFTATANTDTISFIIKTLGLKRPYLIKRLPVNKNNKIICIRGDSKLVLEKLLAKNIPGKAIIYAITRKEVMDIYNAYKNDYSITYYHGDLEREVKVVNQEMFSNSKKNIIVATVAFGMGIDIPDIRTIILYDLPLTIADLIQEIGRAGRDGKPCQSFIILSDESLKLADKLIKKSSNVNKAEAEFDQVISYFYSSKKAKFLKKYFKM